MKAGWQIKTIADIAEVKGGKRAPKGYKLLTESTGFPYLRVTEFMDSGTVDVSNLRYKSAEVHRQIKNYIIYSTDLYISIAGTIGKTGIIPQELNGANLTENACRLVFKPGINNRFVYYFTLSPNFVEQAGLNTRTAAQPKMALSRLAGIKLGIPLLPEQKRIVGILDEAFEGISTAKANAEKNLQNSRALFESHLQAVFTQRGEGWDVRKITEVAKHSLGKMLDKAKNKGKPQRYLRNINVRWFAFDLSNLAEMPFLPGESAKYTATKGDVLICEGGYPGRAAIWAEDYPIYFQKALHRVRFHEPTHNKWFLYYLYAQDKSGELKRHFSGTGIQHFTGAVLARLELPFPPLPELRQAVEKFEELSIETQHLELLYNRKLAALEELKKALLHRAFSGQL